MERQNHDTTGFIDAFAQYRNATSQTSCRDAANSNERLVAGSTRALAAADRIRLGDTHELFAWCEWLGCDEDQLRSAVREAGPMVRDVKRRLGKIL